jgi:hypothetical protein
MKNRFALTLILCSATLFAQSAAPAATSAKVSDLAFFSGRWEGRVDNNKIEQVCSTTDPATLMCMFRLMGARGTEMIELYTIRDTAGGVEEKVRFFSPDLQEDPNDKELTMRMVSFSPDRIVFENPNGTYPKRSTLTRKGDDELTSHIELVDAQGKASAIDAHWVRAK